MKNEWIDEDGNIFLIFSRKEAGEKLNLSDKTVTKAFRELNNVKLIYEKRLGFRKKNIIYVGKRIKIKNVPLNTYFQIRRPELKYQVLYDRLYNRDFITTKEILIQDVEHFIDPSVGLKKCLEHFFQNPRFLSINWQYEAIKDKLTSEFTPLYEIKGIKNKFRYLRYRFL